VKVLPTCGSLRAGSDPGSTEACFAASAKVGRMRGQTLSPPPPSSSRTLSGGVGCSPSSSGWVGREVGREVGRYQSVCTDHATTAAFVESDAVRRCRLLTVLVSMGRTQRIIPPDSWVGRTQGRTAVRRHLREAVSASAHRLRQDGSDGRDNRPLGQPLGCRVRNVCTTGTSTWVL
jgi:hypothetical protein